jgi:hypothetical protein
MHDPAFIQRAQVLGIHAEEIDVMWQKLPGRREKQGKQPRQDQAEREDRQQGPAVTEQLCEKSAVIVYRHGIPTVP